MEKIFNYIRKATLFYINGFRSMTWGRTLWIIIILKLIIMFAILRPFFFQPALEGNAEEKAQHVSKALTEE